jgi:hypothetical protein
MPYITREDGEHFVIPSYRDVLTAKQKKQLKREILALSQNYGEYITLQRKGAAQYEVAFSPDTGYLLGESIWHYFKRPLDMIYCEAIPNTTEAILVIVKSGSVYLDGSFPLESIPEELVIFLTQENSFEIYIYGDVPLSETPVTGKFSFDKSSVKAFQILDKPVFPTLPLLKIYQLQLVEQVLRAAGIGVFPLKTAAVIIVVVGLAWMGYTYINSYNPELVEGFNTQAQPQDQYADYYRLLTAPAPESLMDAMIADLNVLATMPGWIAKSIQFADSGISADVLSGGTSLALLQTWAKRNNYAVDVASSGFRVSHGNFIPKRPQTHEIYQVNNVLEVLIDRIQSVYPGNTLTPDHEVRKAFYTTKKVTITLNKVTPVILSLIGKQLSGLPVIFNNATLNVDDNGTSFSGQLIIEIVGN